MASDPFTFPEEPSHENVGLRIFTKFFVAATLCLIFLGGQVKSHEAGLSVPDWPTTYGQNMFLFPVSSWVGGIWHEHLHRLFASGVGVLSIIAAFWLRWKDSRRWVKNLGYVALLAVIVQGLLGGITVKLLLPAPVSVLHGVLAQTFLLMVIMIAYSQSRELKQRTTEAEAPSSRVLQPALLLTAAVFIQLILGAVMRHTESGLAIPDFPMMAGRILPIVNSDMLTWVNAWRLDYGLETGADLEPVSLSQIWIHLLHRVGALGVVVCAVFMTVRGFRDGGHSVIRAVVLIDALIVGQVLLGAFTIWTGKEPIIASAHVANGALTLGVSTLLVLRCAPIRWREFNEARTLWAARRT